MRCGRERRNGISQAELSKAALLNLARRERRPHHVRGRMTLDAAAKGRTFAFRLIRQRESRRLGAKHSGVPPATALSYAAGVNRGREQRGVQRAGADAASIAPHSLAAGRGGRAARAGDDAGGRSSSNAIARPERRRSGMPPAAGFRCSACLARGRERCWSHTTFAGRIRVDASRLSPLMPAYRRERRSWTCARRRGAGAPYSRSPATGRGAAVRARAYDAGGAQTPAPFGAKNVSLVPGGRKRIQ